MHIYFPVVSLASRLPIYLNPSSRLSPEQLFAFRHQRHLLSRIPFRGGQALRIHALYFEEFLFRTRTVNPWVSAHPSCSFHHGMRGFLWYWSLPSASSSGRECVDRTVMITEVIWSSSCSWELSSCSSVLNHLLHIVAYCLQIIA